jgi:beta-RFAP synthase
MIEAPRYRIRLRGSEQDQLIGPQADRARSVLHRMRQANRSHISRAGVCIEILEAIPPHCGFGSGTQLALAVAQGLHSLWYGTLADAIALSQRLGRSARSAIGTYGATSGGFLVDGGRRGERPAPLISRLDVPSEWRIVLVCPCQNSGCQSAGVCGAEEQAAFRALPPMEKPLTERLCYLALLEILPAVAESDFPAFSRAIDEYGRLVGSYFAPAQGGVVADSEMAALIEVLRQRGHYGIGQSSWGPAIWICASDAAGAERISQEITEWLGDRKWHVSISPPRNCGMQFRRDGSTTEMTGTRTGVTECR